MEFDIEKHAMLKMKSAKRQAAEGRKPQDQENIRTFREKENYKKLEILEENLIEQAEMKGNKKREP